MINMLALDGHIVHAVGAGDRPLGDDLERAVEAAEDFAGLEVLGREPRVAGLAVELVEGGRADFFLGAVLGGKAQFHDARVEVIDRGEDDAAGALVDGRAGLVGRDLGRHPLGQPHFFQVEGDGDSRADGGSVVDGQPVGRHEGFDADAVDRAVGPGVGLFEGQVPPGPLVDGRRERLVGVGCARQDPLADADLLDGDGVEGGRRGRRRP